MSIQTSRNTKVHVGTPPTRKEWEVIEVHYNEFEGLPSERGVPVHSPEFTCFGHKWRLQIYPGGDTRVDDGMVAVFLENLSNESITIQYGFSVKSKDGKVVEDFASISDMFFAPYGTPADNTNRITYLWGQIFCQRSEVIDALVDGTLIVEVRMRNTAETASYKLFIPENTIATSILAMFNDEESADVMFEVGGAPVRSTHNRAKPLTATTLYAHRLILQKCTANVLGELCTSAKGADETTTVLISDVKPDIFKHMLYYIYGGGVSDKDMKDKAKDIIDAADRYGIVGLKLEAEASLVTSTTITFDNAIENLLYADGKNCALLKETVMDFIAENSNEAVIKLSFEDVPGSVVKDLLVAMNRKGAMSNATSNVNSFIDMRVNDLRKLLHEKGLEDVDGSREMMIARLEEAAL